ncbi:MAG TPA: tetratricopeptide repeat protein, partial [Gemmataceae bacterium]|nr:tetratricopeptide repeat protein [Gemmataceae bacterium]
RLWASSRCQPAGSHRPLTEARPALEELTRGLERFAGADRLRLLDGLAEAYARVGDLAEARRLWGQLAEQRPTDLITRFRLFDLALRADDTADARRLAAEVRRLEGENGALAPYCEAALLVQTARHWASSRLTPAGSQRPLAEARRLLALAAERRPSWPRPLLLLADVALLENNVDAAIDHYKQARNLGAGSPELTRRLVDLLYARQRYAEAEEILSQMQNDAPLPAGLSKVAAAIALRREDSGRALELARQAVAGSKDFRDYLWLGRMLWSAGQRDQAEAALRHALRLADNVPDTWVALATYLARADRPAEAEALIEQARRKLPPDLAPLALAQCYLALGRPDRAEEQYRAAVEARPDDVLVRRTVALFYLDRDQLEQAKPHLRFLFAPTTKAPLGDAAWARRTLALALASGGDYAQSFEALTLVELNLQQLGNRPEDLRAKAIVLASRPSRRAEAIELFEEVSRRQPLAPGDQFLLAQLYEAADNWRAAKARMEAAVNSPGGDTPRYLAAYVRALLRHGEVEAARPLCDRLEKLEPKGLRAAEMRARLLHAQGRTAEAVALLQKFAQNADAPQAGLVAALLEELGQPALAEDLYRRFVAASPQPEAVLVLIEYLGRQQRVREALELCERAWQTCPPEAVAAASVIVLRAGEADPELYRPVERRLEAAIEKDPRSVGLLFILANFRDLQGRYDEVKALYRQVLHYDSRHVLALNNLAWLLAVTEGKGDEALALLERAIAIAGPGSNLLDTRGCVRLAMGRAGLAVKDLQEAAAITPTAVTYFHLAQAYQAVKNPGEAAAAFRKAQALGLDAKQLHPLERPAYLRLLAELGSK